MRQPFWIINSSLALILIATMIFSIFTRVKIPRRQPIEPTEITSQDETDKKINLEVIYKNDLFNTYQAQIFLPEKIEEPKEQMPPAPTHIEATIPEPFAPQFFDPLPITLTGIIIEEDDKKSRAIIMDNKTQRQFNYKINDEIEDAQIVRILADKVILLRSNGQQEVLYLRNNDAQLDNPLQQAAKVKNIVKKASEFEYYVDPVRFANYVKNLGELIDLFDLSTAYLQGQSIGSKIGSISSDSLGAQMGLMPGDIIEKINNIPANTTNNRFKIYKAITANKKDGQSIVVQLLRHNQQIAIKYKLKKLESIKTKPAIEGKPLIEPIEERKSELEKIKMLKERYKFAPSIDEIRAREAQNLFKRKSNYAL